MHQHQSTMCKGNEKSFIEDFEQDAGANSGPRPLQCSQCPATFKSYSLLRRHLIRSHEEVLMHGCTDCLQMFTNLFELQEHRRTAHINGCGKPVKCPQCPKRFSSAKSMNGHRRTHRESELIPCPSCPMKFTTLRYLKDHLHSHSNERQFQCHLCQKTFKRKRNLQDHIQSHSGLKQHECHICGCRYAFQSSLKRHIIGHSRPGGKPFKCDVCRKKFAGLHELGSHLQNHIITPVVPDYIYEHYLNELVPANSIIDTPQEPTKTVSERTEVKPILFVPGDLLKKSFDCTECPETFERRSDWLRHFRTHRGSRPYKCTECGKTFLESGDLRNHLIDHSKEMFDSSGDNSNDSCYSMSDEADDDSADDSMDDSLLNRNPTKTLEEFSDQISIDLAEEKHDGIDAYSDFTDNFRDDLSDGGFSELSVTLRQLYHRKNSRPHKCPMCRLRFIQINHLLTHLDTHLPNRPYKCNECNQSFKRPDHLRRHALTHTVREMPFKCSQCSEAFISANYLGRHMRIHGGSNPYPCNHCELKFKSPSSLEKHLRVHDANKVKSSNTFKEGPKRIPYKCTVCLLKFRKGKILMQHLQGHLDRFS